MTLTGPRLEPLDGPARQLVVLLHGVGADGNDLIGLGDRWQEMLPNAMFVAPNAPEPYAGAPMGYQWFALGPDRMASRASGAPLARQQILDYLAGLWAETGIAPEHTLLVGFSQGAMMALHTGLSMDPPPMGIIAFSGALIEPEGFAEGRYGKPPVCIVHGEADQVVDVAYSRDAAATLKARGYEVSLHISPGVGHGIDPDGLAFADTFVAGVSATF